MHHGGGISPQGGTDCVAGAQFLMRWLGSMHGVVTSKQIVTDRDHVVERTGRRKEHDDKD
jgi:hypothetical protein